MLRIHPSPALGLSLDALADAYAVTGPLPHVRGNVVASVDGATHVEGSSRGLGGPADRRLLGLLRDLCDVLLVGAGTARAERYGALRPGPARVARRTALGLPPVPRTAVVSGSLDLDPAADLFTAHPPTIVLTHDRAPAERRAALAAVAEVVVAGAERVDPALAVAALAARGLNRILCEGGPTLLGGLAAADRLDELCLTVSPLAVAGTAGRIVAGSRAVPRPLRLVHTLTEDGMLFLRYTVDRS